MPGETDPEWSEEQRKAFATLADSFAEELGFGEQPNPETIQYEDDLFKQALEQVPEIAQLIVQAMRGTINREQVLEQAKPHVERLKEVYHELAARG